MAAHQHPRVGHGLDPGLHPDAALELDGVHVRFLEEAHGVLHGLLVGDLVGTEGHVTHDEGVRRAAAHGLAVADAVFHGHGDGPLVPQGDHAQGVPTRIMSIPAASAKLAMGKS